MKLSRELLDRLLQVLGWSLLAIFLAMLIGTVVPASDQASPAASTSSIEWAAIIVLTATNLLASLLGLICILCTPYVKELRVTWLLSFVVAIFLSANVLLVPLFRYYALRRSPSTPG